MAPARRHRDDGDPTGVTAVLLVEAGPGHDGAELAAACRHALRDTDAVLERRRPAVIAVLLRHVRRGHADARAVAERVATECAHVAETPPTVVLAVAESDDESLDLLLRRADEQLAAESAPPS